MRALQERSFFASQSYATAVYQSELMYRLRSLATKSNRARVAPEIKDTRKNTLTPAVHGVSKSRKLLRTAVQRPGGSTDCGHNTRDKK